jgi:hypothetical protein
MSKKARSSSRGFSLVAALLLMLLISALSVALMYSVNTERQISSADQEQNIARYAAEGAMEKMVADVASMYSQVGAPSMANISNLSGGANVPAFSGITFSNYTVSAYPDPKNNALPATVIKTQKSGTYAYTIPIHMDVVATRTSTGAQVHIQRDAEIALLPVFQFGIFSDSDLSFFPGPQFDFNGRVFTNGNLFLAASANALSFHTKLSTAGDVVRTVLVNNANVNVGSAFGARNANVLVPAVSGGCDTTPAPTTPIAGKCLSLDMTMSSLASGDPYNGTGAENTSPSWSSTSTKFGGNLQTRWDGVTALTLPFVGGALNNPAAPPPAPWEIIKRPPNNGAADPVGTSREYNLAQIRILLDDNPNDLPGGQQGGANPDVNLAAGTAYNVDGGPNPQYFAMAKRPAYQATCNYQLVAPITVNDACVGPNDPDPGWYQQTGDPNPWPLIRGWLRVEYRDAGQNWHNVTQEWLKEGFARGAASPNSDPSYGGAGANAVNQNAILIFQKRPTPTPPDVTGYIWAGGYSSTATYNTLKQLVIYNGAYYSLIKTGALNKTPNANPTYWQVVAFPTTSPWAYTKFADDTVAANKNTYGWFPINMYDPREGEFAHLTVLTAAQAATSCAAGGLMNVVELDMANLTRWLQGAIPAAGSSGPNVETASQNGYIVYFSDRRGLQTRRAFPGADLDGEYGYEPVVDATNAIWSMRGMESQTGTEFAPSAGNLTMGGQEAGEDINGTVVTINSGGDQLIATHGRFSLGAGFGNKADGKGLSNSGAATQNLSWPNSLAAGTGTQTGSPTDFIDSPAARIQNCAQIGQSNIVMGARHALKIVNGSQGHFRYTDANGNPIGLTIASEQPVYVQGNYNADNNDATNWGGYTHLSSAVIADAVTLLSNVFDDRYSLEYPSTGPSGPRNAVTTYFRVAIAAGKNKPFFVPGNWGSGNGDTGTDGGVHNFIRYLENWGGQTSHYRGSLVSMYYARYGNGIYGNSWVYSPPTRDYSFDTDFLNPNLLPPGTPKLIDMDNLSAHQDLSPRTY